MQRANLEIESPSAARMTAEPILAWKVHLVREHPWRLLLIVPVVFVGLLISCLITRSFLFPAIGLVIFVGALSDYLFPISYEILESGAASRSLGARTFIEWSRVKKYYLDDRGIKLSPLDRPGRLEAYRGVYLRFGGNRDAVIEAVRRMRDALPADSRGG